MKIELNTDRLSPFTTLRIIADRLEWFDKVGSYDPSAYLKEVSLMFREIYPVIGYPEARDFLTDSQTHTISPELLSAFLTLNPAN